MSFDAKKELFEIQAKRKMMKRKRFRASVIDRYKGEVLLLHKAAASLTDIRIFLKSKRVKVVNSTVQRWLQKNG